MRPVKVVEPADLYFEDFAENQELPAVTKGPMTIGHQVRWAAAADNYADEFHYDEAAAKAKGLPGIILSGPLVASYLVTAVNQWVGRNARLVYFVDRNAGPTMPHDTLHLKGMVKRKYQTDSLNMLEIDCHVENQRGEDTTPATARVRIASRTDKTSS
jgi:acyl dehydratase